MTPALLNKLLWTATVALGAAIAAMTADGVHIPVSLDVAAAIAGALATGQHLDKPHA